MIVHIFAMDSYIDKQRKNTAIVISNNVNAYSGPFYGNNSLIFQINEGIKDKIIKYGDSINLTKSGKKKHKIHPYYVKYKQKNQIDINNNIVTAMKSPNLKLTYER